MPPLFVVLFLLALGAIFVLVLNFTGVVNMKLSEVTTRLGVMADRLEKVRKEVQALKDIVLSDPDAPPELVAQLGRVDTSLTAVDDINQDAPADPPADPPPQG